MDNWDSQLRNQHTQPPRTAAAAKPQTCKHVYEPNWGFFAAVSMRNGFPGSAHKVTWHLLVLFIRRVIWWRKRCESEFLARAEHTVSLLYRGYCYLFQYQWYSRYPIQNADFVWGSGYLSLYLRGIWRKSEHKSSRCDSTFTEQQICFAQYSKFSWDDTVAKLVTQIDDGPGSV